MAVAFVLDLPMTAEQSSAVLQALNLGGKPPQGQVLHIEGPRGSGTRVVDVWESEAAFQTFFETKLLPAFQKVGVEVGTPPTPEWWPITAVLK